MNLTMTTNWSQQEHRTYLIVTVSAGDHSEATASQMYLDIHLPEGVRIRHIGDLSTDGHGNAIGVDLPDLAANDQHNLVFRVKSRQAAEQKIAPELHLHWIDSETGDLLERHQTGTAMPTEPGEIDANLAEIVASARSERNTAGRESRRHPLMKENESMNIERYPRAKRHAHCGHNHREAGHRAGGQAHGAMKSVRGEGRHHRHSGRGHLHLTIERMQQQIDYMERRMRRLQRMAQAGAWSSGEQVSRRPRRRCESDVMPSRRHADRRMYDEGRRMGRMARRAFAASTLHYDREDTRGDRHAEE